MMTVLVKNEIPLPFPVLRQVKPPHIVVRPAHGRPPDHQARQGRVSQAQQVVRFHEGLHDTVIYGPGTRLACFDQEGDLPLRRGIVGMARAGDRMGSPGGGMEDVAEAAARALVGTHDSPGMDGDPEIGAAAIGIRIVVDTGLVVSVPIGARTVDDSRTARTVFIEYLDPRETNGARSSATILVEDPSMDPDLPRLEGIYTAGRREHGQDRWQNPRKQPIFIPGGLSPHHRGSFHTCCQYYVSGRQPGSGNRVGWCSPWKRLVARGSCRSAGRSAGPATLALFRPATTATDERWRIKYFTSALPGGPER